MLTDAQVQAHADRIRDDGFTVIESAASPKLIDGLITALQRTERADDERSSVPLPRLGPAFFTRPNSRR